MNKDLISHIEKYYEDKTSEEIEHTLLAIESDYYQDKFSWEKDSLRRSLLIWCDYEDFPDFFAYVAYEAKLDIEKVLTCIYREALREEKEWAEEREFQEYEYKRVQGWR